MIIDKKPMYTIKLSEEEIECLFRGLREYENSEQFSKKSQTEMHKRKIISFINVLYNAIASVET